jgi:hypothetical protein
MRICLSTCYGVIGYRWKKKMGTEKPRHLPLSALRTRTQTEARTTEPPRPEAFHCIAGSCLLRARAGGGGGGERPRRDTRDSACGGRFRTQSGKVPCGHALPRSMTGRNFTDNKGETKGVGDCGGVMGERSHSENFRGTQKGNSKEAQVFSQKLSRGTAGARRNT